MSSLILIPSNNRADGWAINENFEKYILVRDMSEIARKTNVSNDSINRWDAIDTICSHCAVKDPKACSTIQNGDTWCEEVYTLMNLPSAEKTGHWIYKTADSYIQRTCSACGWSERVYHRNRNQDGLIRNFCPNCGARMGDE